MPQPYGNDRMIRRKDGTIVLMCPCSKGWIGRRERTSTSPTMAGTAVLWDEEYWEVRKVEAVAGERVSYHLTPWIEGHTIRSFEGYSAGHEAARTAERKADALRASRTRAGAIFAFVLGLLPADLQSKAELEFGVSAERMTMLSTIPFMLFGVYCAANLRIEGLAAPEHPLPRAVTYLGLFLFFESLIRLRSALARQPIGELFVSLPYMLFVAPFRTPKRPERPAPLPPPQHLDESIRDAFTMREPFLAFLSPREQLEMQRIFDFDPIKWGRITASVVLAGAGTGFVAGVLLLFSIFTLGRVLSTVVAAGVALEQIGRLRELARGQPAGSFLAPVVRPFTKRLFDPGLFGVNDR